MRANDVFISYSTKNTEIAKSVKNFLQSHDINCWMAPESIPAGSNYTKEIPYGILYSKLAVLILSKPSIDSIWVNQEVTYLLESNKIIIPFVVDDINNYSGIKEEPYSNLNSDDFIIADDTTTSYFKLLQTIQKQLPYIEDFNMPDCSDDYLQLGLKEIEEDGGMLFDKGRAEILLRKSADLGNAVAMRYLALLIHDERTKEESQLWWEKAAQNGDIPSLLHEAKRLSFSDIGVHSNNLKKATEMLSKVVENDNHRVWTCYATLLLNTSNIYFTEENCKKALSLLMKAVEKKNYEAALVLGDLYREGIIVSENPAKAFEYYQIASVADDLPEATLKLADCYHNGYGTEVDLKKAFQGYADFCYYSEEYTEKYADCYNYGYGIRKNKKKALDIYQDIVINSDKMSDIQKRVITKRFELGDMRCAAIIGNQAYLENKYEDAFKFYTIASKQKLKDGFFGQGKCYLYGYGVKCDKKKAFLCFSKAFSLKCKDAAEMLAYCYEHGIGTQKNEMFSRYFNRILEMGDNCMWNLSFMGGK